MKEALKILRKNELKELSGIKNVNLWVFISILSLTLIGLGHSIGGIKDLSVRMNNPFTNWVNLPIPSNKEDFEKSVQVIEEFNAPSAKARYALDTIIGYKRGFLKLSSFDSKENYYATIRTVSPNEALLSEVLNNSLSTGEPDISENDCWIVLKDDFIRTLGYPEKMNDLEKVEVLLSYNQQSSLSFFIDVVCIVSELPDRVDAIVPEHMYELFFSPFSNTNLIESGKTNRIDILSDFDLEKDNPVLNEILSKYDCEVESVYAEEVDFHPDAKFLNEIYLSSSLELKDKLVISESLVNDVSHGFWPYNSHNCLDDEYRSITAPSNLAFIFNDLSAVREMRNKIKAHYGFEISLNQVEDKENFARITLLTSILSILLFAISLTSIIIYLIKLLISHFDRIQVNLGTFKAFGLENKYLVSSYLHILTLFFLRALVASLLIVIIYSFLIRIIGWKFSLYHWSLPLGLLVIFIIYYFSSKFVISKRLEKTPGDLIYRR